MNDFTKDELEELHFFTALYQDRYKVKHPEPILAKLQDLIDNYIECEEKEIFSCHTGLAISDNLFCHQQHVTEADVLPAIYQLVNQCNGMIKEPGIYAFKLRLVKIK